MASCFIQGRISSILHGYVERGVSPLRCRRLAARENGRRYNDRTATSALKPISLPWAKMPPPPQQMDRLDKEEEAARLAREKQLRSSQKLQVILSGRQGEAETLVPSLLYL